MKTLRWINGEYYWCIDIGCPDLASAKANRDRVANHECCAGYQQVERALALIPLGKPLPSWIPHNEESRWSTC
jgi:hypothetical protein